MGVILGDFEGLITDGLPGGLSPPDSGGGTPPGIPQNLVAFPTDSEVTLTWDQVTGATGYNIYRDGVFLHASGEGSGEAVDDTAVNGVTYSYTVSATGPGGESEQSDPATATPTSGGSFTYLQPGGSFTYKRPGGVFSYLRP